MAVSPLYIVLDVTVLDNLAKSHVDHEGQIVYRRLPGAAAQQVVRSVIEVWKASLSALRDFAKHPGKYTGRPQFPGFQPKDGHFPLEMPSVSPGFMLTLTEHSTSSARSSKTSVIDVHCSTQCQDS